MSVNAITQGNGADLLALFQQSQGQQTTAVDATTNALKKAIVLAQDSAAQVLGGGSPDTSSLNVYA